MGHGKAEDFVKRGEAALKEIVGEPESFQLEFKEKSDPDTYVMSKEDKRTLGKALSGLSNADGGLIIYGIRTTRRDHQDVAQSLQPIAGIDRFKSEVDGRLGELLRPANPSIMTHAVPTAASDDRGYLLLEVGKSPLRPHMNMAPGEQRFYRRSVEGTVPMDTSLIRDMMMAPRESHLSPIWRFVPGSSSGAGGGFRFNRGKLELHFGNVGLAMAAMPYARVWLDQKLQPTPGQFVTVSRRSDGSFAFYGARDAVIHPSDEVLIGSFELDTAYALDTITYALSRERWQDAVSPENWQFCRTYDRQFRTSIDRFDSLHLRVAYGAENAPMQEDELALSRLELVLMTAPAVVQLSEEQKAAIRNAYSEP